MTVAIAIAAGGGGDAVTAAMLADALPDLGIAAIMSYSWDRFMIDPTPGPRTRSDFTGLIPRGAAVEIPETAALRTGRSTLPCLAGCIAQPLLLLEADGGAAGIAQLLRSAAAVFDADELIVVDAGGDILAEGHEVTLRSPLADSLALAGGVRSGIPTRVLVAGPGLDGELPPNDVYARLHKLEARQVVNLSARDAAPFAEVWSWHPSEVNALVAAAACGWRGAVECQRDAVVDLTSTASRVYEVDARTLVDSSLAATIFETGSLEEAERILRDHRGGRSELDVERSRAAGERARAVMPTMRTLKDIDDYAEAAAGRHVDALTVRRVAELVSAIDPPSTQALRELLAAHRPGNFRPPLYKTRYSAE